MCLANLADWYLKLNIETLLKLSKKILLRAAVSVLHFDHAYRAW